MAVDVSQIKMIVFGVRTSHQTFLRPSNLIEPSNCSSPFVVIAVLLLALICNGNGTRTSGGITFGFAVMALHIFVVARTQNLFLIDII